MVSQGPAQEPGRGESLARSVIDELNDDAEAAFWRLRTMLLREIGRRTRDADLSAVGTSEPIRQALMQASAADLLDALTTVNRERSRRNFAEWTDVSAQVALLLGSPSHSTRSHRTLRSDQAKARWWIDGVPGEDREKLVQHVVATRGVLLTQTVIRRHGQLLFLSEHLHLVRESLDRVGFAGWWPGDAALVEIVTSGAGDLSANGNLRLDIGPVMEGNLDTASAPLLLVVGETQPDAPLPDSVGLALNAAPVHTIPPLAGLPLGMTADRAVAFRSAHRQGLDEAVLFDQSGYVVDLCASTVFLGARDGTWFTPSSDSGAQRSPLRRRVIDILDAEERTDINWPTLACSALYVLGRDARVAQVTRLGTLPTSADESFGIAITRARDVALDSA